VKENNTAEQWKEKGGRKNYENHNKIMKILKYFLMKSQGQQSGKI
jgi:hypothetical protein